MQAPLGHISKRRQGQAALLAVALALCAAGLYFLAASASTQPLGVGDQSAPRVIEVAPFPGDAEQPTRTAVGDSRVRVIVDGAEQLRVVGAFVACFSEGHGILWQKEVAGSAEWIVAVPARTRLRFGFLAPNQGIRDWHEFELEPAESATASFDLRDFGICKFDLSTIPTSLRAQPCTIRLYEKTGSVHEWTALLGDASHFVLLAAPIAATAQILLDEVILVSDTGCRGPFPLRDGAAYSLGLPPDMFRVVAYNHSSRITSFAVTGLRAPRLTSTGVALVSAQDISESQIVVISQDGWGFMNQNQLLPSVDNVVRVESKWIELDVELDRDFGDGVGLQLSGPSSDGEPLLPIQGDIRVRSSQLTNRRCRFSPVTPGIHHVRFLSADGHPSAVVASVRIDCSPQHQALRLEVGKIYRAKCIIKGMDELLGFLGVNYISNGEGDVVGRDGVLYTWALEEHLDYLPSYQVDLPRGLPVSLWRNIDGDYTGTLSGAVAFVTAQADAQHGGVVSFRRPGLAGRLRDSNGMVRFVGTQGDECPLLIWERTENRELLLGALLKVPHERYPVVHCDTAGRWVALDFADPLDAVEVTAHIGNVAAPLGAFATHLPAVIWVPYAASALTFKKPQRSLRVQIADEAELRVLL